MKLVVCRVLYHTVLERNGREVSHTSPIQVVIAARSQAELFEALPVPVAPTGMTARHVITQIDQKHKDVLFNDKGSSALVDENRNLKKLLDDLSADVT